MIDHCSNCKRHGGHYKHGDSYCSYCRRLGWKYKIPMKEVTK